MKKQYNFLNEEINYKALKNGLKKHGIGEINRLLVASDAKSGSKRMLDAIRFKIGARKDIKNITRGAKKISSVINIPDIA